MGPSVDYVVVPAGLEGKVNGVLVVAGQRRGDLSNKEAINTLATSIEKIW